VKKEIGNAAQAGARIAHLVGPAATIQNTPQLVISSEARLKYGLPPRSNRDRTLPAFDPLRAQRLKAPAKPYLGSQGLLARRVPSSDLDEFHIANREPCR
jgi:hypothetical protein